MLTPAETLDGCGGAKRGVEGEEERPVQTLAGVRKSACEEMYIEKRAERE